MTDLEIVLIAHNLRSCYNVGSLIRTAEGLGVKQIYLTGYTPCPESDDDNRLPYLRSKINNQIKKTSLGAEKFVNCQHQENILDLLKLLKKQEYLLVALEQSINSIDLDEFTTSTKLALLVGREVEGIEKDLLGLMDKIVSIPMLGKKESFNVTQAAAMAIYRLRFF